MANETHVAAEHHEGGHGTIKQYLLVFAILAIITGAEVAIFYVEALSAILVPALIIMSLGKFILVVLYYMHLKFDSKIFARVFYGPLLLAVLVVVGLLIIFGILDQYRV